MTSMVAYNEMGRGSDQSAMRTWPCACARMCRAYDDDDISLLTHDKRKCYNNVKHCKPNTVNEKKSNILGNWLIANQEVT